MGCKHFGAEANESNCECHGKHRQPKSNVPRSGLLTANALDSDSLDSIAESLLHLRALVGLGLGIWIVILGWKVGWAIAGWL